VFLGRLGIEARADALSASASPRQAADVRSALQRLIDPAGMGSLFAAMAMTSPGQAAPAGFETDGPEAP
jgi:NADH dehydrogenase [ubiquinone] 1 alpha subcomplex assembly factor 7